MSCDGCGQVVGAAEVVDAAGEVFADIYLFTWHLPAACLKTSILRCILSAAIESVIYKRYEHRMEIL
jgi:hypothetical protein